MNGLASSNLTFVFNSRVGITGDQKLFKCEQSGTKRSAYKGEMVSERREPDNLYL